MSVPLLAGAVVYAKNLARVSRFYARVAGLNVLTQDDDHVVLEAPGFQLVVVAMAVPFAARVEAEPRRREDTALKLVFVVPSIAVARDEAMPLGGVIDEVAREWRFQGHLVCDGHDPEGNVIQLRQVTH